jgi:uncharacterized protein with NRDE domain
MCTLSVFPNSKGTIITMNRDEKRSRGEAENISITDTYCFPVDVPSQGTWVGMNRFGLVFALLNRYQDEHPEGGQQSRGQIIPSFLSSVDLHEVQKKLDGFEVENYNPFDFLIIELGNIIHVSWDGKRLLKEKQSLDDPFFISSSSERASEVLRYRRNVFTDFLNQTPFQECDIMSGLHLKRQRGHEGASIFMEREKVHTKSITQILLKSDQSDMFYWPQDILAKNNSVSYEQAISYGFL